MPEEWPEAARTALDSMQRGYEARKKERDEWADIAEDARRQVEFLKARAEAAESALADAEQRPMKNWGAAKAAEAERDALRASLAKAEEALAEMTAENSAMRLGLLAGTRLLALRSPQGAPQMSASEVYNPRCKCGQVASLHHAFGWTFAAPQPCKISQVEIARRAALLEAAEWFESREDWSRLPGVIATKLRALADRTDEPK